MPISKRAVAAPAFAVALAATGLSLAPAGFPLRDVAIDLGGGARLEIGAVRFDSLVPVALAQGAGSVTLDNLALTSGTVKVSIPRIVFEGASLDRAALAGLFDAKATEPLAPRLAKLSARRVSAPEVVFEQDVAGHKQLTRYLNVVASDISEGRVKSATADGAGITGRTPQGASTGTMGRTTLSGLDLSALAAMLAGASGAESGPMRRIYGAYSVEAMNLTQENVVEIRIERMSGQDFLARPTKRPMMEIVGEFPEAKPGETPSPAEQAKALAAMSEIFGAFSFGTAEMSGMTLKSLEEDSKVTFQIGRVRVAGEASNGTPETRIENLTITDPETVKARIGAIVFSGYSFSESIAALKELGEKGVEKIDENMIRRLVPVIGTMRFSDFDFDIRPKAEDGETPEPIRFTMKELVARSEKVLNGIPTEVSLALEGLRVPIDPATQTDGIKTLAEMGYKEVALSFSMAALWNESASDLEVSEIALSLAEMGSAKFRGTVGNVTRDAFDADSTLALVAWLGATAKAADVTIENKGLFEKLLASNGRDQGKSPDAIRREFAAAAAIALPQMLGNSTKAKELSRVAARFIAKPGRLVVKARTKEPLGLGIADLANIQDPDDILEQLEITATAE